MTTMISAEDRDELRLITFHERNVETLIRQEALDKVLEEAIVLTQDARLPRHSIEFILQDQNFSIGWSAVTGLGAAMETYIRCLDEMHCVRRSRRGHGSFAFLQPSFDAVKVAAKALADLGWPVNWQQNVQLMLELSEFGIQDGMLVDRYQNLPPTTTLGQRLHVLGGLAFYMQKRDGVKITSTKIKLLAGHAREMFEMTPLRLQTQQNLQPRHCMYTSDWIYRENTSKSLRVYA